MGIEPKFRDRDTESFASNEYTRRLAGVPRTGWVRLERLYAAQELRDLRTPPGNRFEPLHGDREGQYSIRINDQWRICFNWSDERREAYNIEIADYH